MNERIKELFQEAYSHFNKNGTYFTQELLAEKFAGLIVKECSAFVYNYPEKYLTRNQAREISLSMEKLFGVEE